MDFPKLEINMTLEQFFHEYLHYCTKNGLDPLEETVRQILLGHAGYSEIVLRLLGLVGNGPRKC